MSRAWRGTARLRSLAAPFVHLIPAPLRAAVSLVLPRDLVSAPPAAPPPAAAAPAKAPSPASRRLPLIGDAPAPVPLYVSNFNALRTPPSWLNLMMSTSRLCNYRCRHCHIWMQKDSHNAMTTAERVEVIRQFAALNPQGTVILPGGEVMMNLPELFALAGACRTAGLQLLINSNGSYVVDEAVARAVVESGITRLTISLDSHVAEVHQYARGIPTAFEDTVRAIRLLVEAMAKYNPGFHLSVSCVVFDRNLQLLAGYVDFCRQLGVSSADFQLLSRTFANKHATRDVFWEEHFFHSPAAKEEACEVIADTLRKNSDGFLMKSESDMHWIRDYITQPDQGTFETSEPICGSHEKNLMVNPGGEVALCHSNWSVLPNDPYIGNAKEHGVFDLWTGPKAQSARRVMDQCRLGCGALNCHRR